MSATKEVRNMSLSKFAACEDVCRGKFEHIITSVIQVIATKNIIKKIK